MEEQIFQILERLYDKVTGRSNGQRKNLALRYYSSWLPAFT